MGPLAIAGMGLGLAGGLYSGLSNIFGGRKEEKQAMQDLAEFDYPELNNVFEGMSISTMGGDILREDAGQASADILDTARESGGRYLFGALPQAVKTTERASRAAATDIDRQFLDRERMVAQGNERIQGVKERRAEQEVAGIGSRINYGRQRKQAGFRDLTNTGFATSSMLGKSGGTGQAPPSSDFNSTVPEGVSYPSGAFDITNPMFGNTQGNPSMYAGLVNPLTGRPYGQ